MVPAIGRVRTSGMGRTGWRLRLIKIAVLLAALLPLAAGIAFAIGGEPAALVVTGVTAAAGVAIAALPLVLPARRFELWVSLSAGLMLVAGVVLLWLGGLLLWPAAAVLGAAIPWRVAWRPIALTLGVLVALGGVVWGGGQAWTCVNPQTRMLVRFHEPPSGERHDRLLREEGVVGISWMDPGTELDVEFDDDAGAARDRLAERLRRDPAVVSVNARPEPCD